MLQFLWYEPYFYIAIPIQPYMNPEMNELQRICEFFSLMTSIGPERKTATIKTTGISIENIIAPHFLQNEDAYREFVGREKE